MCASRQLVPVHGRIAFHGMNVPQSVYSFTVKDVGTYEVVSKSVPLFLMILTVLSSTSQVFCRKPKGHV